ncbi:MAG: hypothetical protein ACTSVE_13250 [Candidatus Helarchaeota archaeon]
MKSNIFTMFFRRRRNKKISAKILQEKIADLKNLEHVLVLQKGSGIKLFAQSFCSQELFPDLLSGLIEAVTLMGERISGEKLRKLSYENYQVLIFDGKRVKGVCVLSDVPVSNFLVDALTVFIKKFEGKFAGTLLDWKGTLEVFNSAVELLDEAFSTYLIFPVSLVWNGTDENLSKSELAILEIAREFRNSREFYTIPELISEIKKKIKKSELELLNIVNDLLERGYFISSTCT